MLSIPNACNRKLSKYKMTKITFISLILLTMQTVVCLCQEKRQDMIWVVLQPEAEIDKMIDFEIYFACRPDENSLQIESVAGFEIEGSSIREKGEVFSFYTYAKPTKLGEIDIPAISVKIDGVEYKSVPISINIVETLEVDSNSVKTILISDSSVYKLQDTIKLSLYQYSRFSNISRQTPVNDKISPLDGISMERRENEIVIQNEQTLFEISGILNLENYLNDNFEITDFKWDPFNQNQTVEKFENEHYIRTNIFSISLLAGKEGIYMFQPSTFEYLVYKSNSDYFKRFSPNKDGSFTITNEGASEIEVCSNPVTITVK